MPSYKNITNVSFSLRPKTLKLENESDASHPITQTEIAKTINAVYSCERKTVGRNIGFLKEIGYPIVKTSKGFYLNQKPFSIEEVKFIINAINSSVEKNEEKKRILLIGFLMW